MRKLKKKKRKQGSKAQGTVYLVGAGPGDAGLMTLRGAELLSSADAVVYDWLVNPSLLLLAPQAEKIYVGKNIRARQSRQHDKREAVFLADHDFYSGRGRQGVAYVKQDKTNQWLVKLARRKKTVVRLKGGDPFIFGRGAEEALYLKKAGISYEIVPGISAGYAVPAYAGIPVTDRRFSSSVIFATGHEDPSKKNSSVDWRKLAKVNGTLVSFMGVGNLDRMVGELREGGMNPETKVSVIEWGSLPRQRVVEGTIETIAARVKNQKIESPSIAVFGEVNRLRKDLKWFEAKPLFGKSVLVTRARAQASGLKKILEEKGARVVEFPAIKILPPKNWGPLDDAFKNIAQFDWVVFTSANGVDFVFKRLGERGKDSRIFHPAKIAAIGEMTQTALANHGLKADFTPSQFTSESLAKELRGKINLRGLHFLLPRTDIAPDLLRKKLEAAGAKVIEVVAYRTLPSGENSRQLNHWLEKKMIDYVLFTSSSTVRNFFEAVPAKQRTKISARLISIGPVTSAAIKSYGCRPWRTAHEHTVAGIVRALPDGTGKTGAFNGQRHHA